MTQAIAKQETFGKLESVIAQGDLSKLNETERVSYYKQLCESLGLNPLTKPFEYINLNGKLTLYARKDATDQLRKVHGVSIEDVDVKETTTQFIVKVVGRDKTGRSDVDLGVVNKTDMRGDTANAMMKAVTKGKRRLALSLCGLGMLDETEVETIPNAKPLPPVQLQPQPINELDEEIRLVCKKLNENGNPVWTPKKVREFASDLFSLEISNVFELDNEKRQYLIDALNDELFAITENVIDAEAVEVPHVSEIRNPIATSLMDLIVARELGKIQQLARELEIDANQECQKVLKCNVDGLSKMASLSFINYLQDLQNQQTAEVLDDSTKSKLSTIDQIRLVEKELRELKVEVKSYNPTGKTIDDMKAELEALEEQLERKKKAGK